MNRFIAGDRMPSSPKGAKMLARAYPALDRPPELEPRLRRRLKPTNDSWRADETYIRVKGKWAYLYRAVDYSGATIDFLLSAKRGRAAERFLAKALSGLGPAGALVSSQPTRQCLT